MMQTMGQTAAHVQHIVHACVCMHNLIRIRYPAAHNGAMDMEDDLHNIIPGSWRDEDMLIGLQHLGGNHQTKEGKNVREYLKHYYVSPAGRVPWQERITGQGHLVDEEED
jgi:hypothetical protein